MPGAEDTLIFQKMFENKSAFWELTKVYEYFLILPISTCECERVFANMTRIKTKNRSLLSDETLEDLLLVSMNGDHIQYFDFNQAITL